MTAALDLADVAAFVQAAELASFTKAAQALGMAQSLVSTRVKRLETRLGHMLLQRHPRLVRLTPEGERFLPAARALLAAQAQAVAVFAEARERVAVGISEQAVGSDIASVLSQLARRDPGLVIDLRIERSQALEDAFERGELDAVIVRRVQPGRTGEVLREDEFGWFSVATLQRQASEPVPLVSVVAECGLRRHGIDALERAGLPWREAVIGGGMAAVTAALLGGLGVSPLARRIAPPGTVEISEAWGLPDLGSSEVVLRSQVATPRSVAFVRELAAAFR
jgi:DNA-binding transcriptional LysR family regulator